MPPFQATDLDAIQGELARWFRSVGGSTDMRAAAAKLREEVGELADLLEDEARARDEGRVWSEHERLIVDEIADVALVLIVLCSIRQEILSDLIATKHVVNLRRTWTRGPSGELRHVRTES